MMLFSLRQFCCAGQPCLAGIWIWIRSVCRRSSCVVLCCVPQHGERIEHRSHSDLGSPVSQSVSQPVSQVNRPDGSKLGAHEWRKQGEWAQMKARKAEQGKVVARSSLRPREKSCEDGGPLAPDHHSQGIWI